jgi:hypothetical protein
VGVEIVQHREEGPGGILLKPVEKSGVHQFRVFPSRQIRMADRFEQHHQVAAIQGPHQGIAKIGENPVEVEESTAETIGRRKVIRIGRKCSRAVSARSERLGQRGISPIVGLHLRAMLERKPPGEERRVRRKGPRRSGDGILEEHALGGKPIQVRRRGARVTECGKMVGAHRVHHYDQHVRDGLRRGRKLRGSRFPHAVVQDLSGHDQQHDCGRQYGK